MWLEFLITSIVVVVAPGTGVVYTIAIGLARGATPSVAAAAGCTLGIIPAMTAAILGLAALLHTSTFAFELFKYAGAVFLLYMAWMILSSHGVLEVQPEQKLHSMAKVAVTGFLINILNPKLAIFFLAFLPQFIPSGTVAPVTQMFAMGTIFMAMTFAVFIGYGVFASSMRRHVISHPMVMKSMNAIFALVFVALALRLALASI
ncbi:LysE family translocator [Roseibium marinum]|uniref:Threonine/homoserine/homoserine lactone efflux protein n=1 Tax=Roseibium marinum TaxID=281252 RepID=A0A2S3V1H8_9HYPH|nr:LysE family translocator [Roseibium marinum]POF33643.1 threonine/homoserine/homoserine lactone efflux protein [Roseibium marinum]